MAGVEDTLFRQDCCPPLEMSSFPLLQHSPEAVSGLGRFESCVTVSPIAVQGVVNYHGG